MADDMSGQMPEGDSPTTEVGSGFMHRSIVIKLHEGCASQYKAALTGMIRKPGRGGFTKKQVDDMTGGFDDGFRSAINALKEMGVIRIDEHK